LDNQNLVPKSIQSPTAIAKPGELNKKRSSNTSSLIQVSKRSPNTSYTCNIEATQSLQTNHKR